jgi:hypothetical protein
MQISYELYIRCLNSTNTIYKIIKRKFELYRIIDKKYRTKFALNLH